MTTPERLPEQPVQPETIQPEEQPAPSEQTPVSSSSQPPSDQQSATTDDATQVQKQDDSSKRTVSVPAANEEQLETMSKGNPENAQTWFGVMWIRKIKKTLHRGIRVIFKGV